MEVVVVVVWAALCTETLYSRAPLAAGNWSLRILPSAVTVWL